MRAWPVSTSLSDWQGTAPNYTFAGLKWYRFMVGLDRFWVDLDNNLRWLVLGVVPTTVLALCVAYLLEIGAVRGIEAYLRTLVLYPAAMSFVVTGTIWSWMYQADRGVLNTLLRAVGLDALASGYTTDPATATYWLILIFVWQYLGLAVLILQASFRSVELQEMVESATLDGASRLRILIAVLIPNIRGGILVVVSLLLISALKVFDIVYVVTFGGPGYATDVLALFQFIATYQQHLVALGSGLAVVIFALSVISLTVTALSVFVGGLGGYFLARFRWPVTKVLFVLLAIALYLPYQAVLIPLVRLMATTRLALTHFGLILSYLILNVPLAAILMATFFFSVPRELEESAQVDGASRLQIFFRIVSVVALPGYASTAILVFIQVWNEFLLALTLVTPYTTTIQVKLNDIKGSYVALYNLQMAAALIMVVVPLTFFLFLGKYFIRGVLAGALKG